MRKRDTMLITARRLALILTGSVLMAFNINTFVHAGGLIPGGFTGLTILFQEIGERYFGVAIPFSVIIFILNAVPAAISFKFIGKRFSIYSCLMIVVSGFLTDLMPSMFTAFLQLQDTLLSAVFGGILNAFSIALCLHAGATSGGTDFIAISISEKYGKDAWGYIFVGNCVILCVAAGLFSLDKALYSIIFQFASTIGLSYFYRGYQQRTMLIITNKTDVVYPIVRDTTHHDATRFIGTGLYKNAERDMLYSVVSADDIMPLTAAIRKADPAAFINVLKTEHINGRFYRKPKD